MTPANDNLDPTRHARAVLHHVLKGRTDIGVRINAALIYARSHDPASMDATLVIAGTDVAAVARAVMREGRDLTQAGEALGGYGTDHQARAWAKAKLETATSMLLWHRQRIEHEAYTERVVERCKVLSAQNKALISRVA
jgi:hypothetical protein